MSISITDLHRIVGEYLADPRLRISRFSVVSAGISLSVVDAASIRHARSLMLADRYSYVGTVAVDNDQLVTVSFTRPDGVYVSVTLTVTDPAVVAGLRAVRSLSANPNRVLAALPHAGGAR